MDLVSSPGVNCVLWYMGFLQCDIALSQRENSDLILMDPHRVRINIDTDR